MHARHCHQSVETFSRRTFHSRHAPVLAPHRVPWKLASHPAQLDSKQPVFCQSIQSTLAVSWGAAHAGSCKPSSTVPTGFAHKHYYRCSRQIQAAQGGSGETAPTTPGLLNRAGQLALKVALLPVALVKAIAGILAMTPEDWAKWRQGVGASLKSVGDSFRQQWRDLCLAASYVFKAIQGQPLTRRERAHVVRSAADTIKLIPMFILFLLPGGAIITPVLLNFFPTMLPSTFDSHTAKEERAKKQLTFRQETAAALQEMMADVASAQRTNAPSDAPKLSQLMRKVRSGLTVDNADIIQVAPLFSNQLTLDRLDRPQLVAACKFYGLLTFGPDGALRKRLYNYLQHIEKDDVEIKADGVEHLTEDELRAACVARGMRAQGPAPVLTQQLKDWLELSVKRVLPDSLVLLAPVLTMQSD